MLDLALHWPGSSASVEIKVIPNLQLYARISVIWATTTSVDDKDDKMTSTQLDSHVNMAVVGCHSTVINRSGKSADVRPFSKDCSQISAVPIFDAAVAYYLPYTLKTYILVVKMLCVSPQWITTWSLHYTARGRVDCEWCAQNLHQTGIFDQ